jgi:hypothetical protein
MNFSICYKHASLTAKKKRKKIFVSEEKSFIGSATVLIQSFKKIKFNKGRQFAFNVIFQHGSTHSSFISNAITISSKPKYTLFVYLIRILTVGTDNKRYYFFKVLTVFHQISTRHEFDEPRRNSCVTITRLQGQKQCRPINSVSRLIRSQKCKLKKGCNFNNNSKLDHRIWIITILDGLRSFSFTII